MTPEYSLGWRRELPDIRDWTMEHAEAERLLQSGKPLFALAPAATMSLTPPPKVDLTKWCSPIENQGRLGSCTAQAAVGLVEYLEKRALGRHIDGSRLFVYKTTRNLLGWRGDTGAYLRTTIKALADYGVCPEKYWPYDIAQFDSEPSAFCYATAALARTLRYFRLDGPKKMPEQVLDVIKFVTAIGLPSVFGFVVYNFGNKQGEFLFPKKGDKAQGGHAMLCVGYDDEREIDGVKGALKIRNSWGTQWGEDGYGWLPYQYVLSGLTADWWTIFAQDYLGD